MEEKEKGKLEFHCIGPRKLIEGSCSLGGKNLGNYQRLVDRKLLNSSFPSRCIVKKGLQIDREPLTSSLRTLPVQTRPYLKLWNKGKKMGRSQ